MFNKNGLIKKSSAHIFSIFTNISTIFSSPLKSVFSFRQNNHFVLNFSLFFLILHKNCAFIKFIVNLIPYRILLLLCLPRLRLFLVGQQLSPPNHGLFFVDHNHFIWSFDRLKIWKQLLCWLAEWMSCSPLADVWSA